MVTKVPEARPAGDELWRLSACEIAGLVAARSVSTREVAVDALARLEAVNPAINAVVDYRPEEVLADAEALDARLAAGNAPGPLCGVPVTVKVIVDQLGFASTNGITLQRDLIADEDNPVVANLRAAGAILLGRTNTPAFSYRWFTSNRLHGHTRNPRDPALTPGGSSGGAAAAVAAGIGAIGHGTDIAGSVRYPAYACGVHGLRPTIGRIPIFNPTRPTLPIGPQLTAVSGPIARTIGDVRLALAAMACANPNDPWWVPAPLTGPDTPKRAAVCLRPGGLETDPVVADAVMRAADLLRDAGWQVEELADLPPLREAAELLTIFWLAETFPALLAAAEQEGDAGALNVLNRHRAFIEGLGPGAVLDALSRRTTLARAWSKFLADYAVALLPISAEPPFLDDLDLRDEASFRRVWSAQMTQVGLPAIGIPALAVSMPADGRQTTLGVQIVAARFREDLCLAAGEVIEAGGVPPAPIDPVSRRR